MPHPMPSAWLIAVCPLKAPRRPFPSSPSLLLSSSPFPLPSAAPLLHERSEVLYQQELVEWPRADQMCTLCTAGSCRMCLCRRRRQKVCYVYVLVPSNLQQTCYDKSGRSTLPSSAYAPKTQFPLVSTSQKKKRYEELAFTPRVD